MSSSKRSGDDSLQRASKRDKREAKETKEEPILAVVVLRQNRLHPTKESHCGLSCCHYPELNVRSSTKSTDKKQAVEKSLARFEARGVSVATLVPHPMTIDGVVGLELGIDILPIVLDYVGFDPRFDPIRSPLLRVSSPKGRDLFPELGKGKAYRYLAKEAVMELHKGGVVPPYPCLEFIPFSPWVSGSWNMLVLKPHVRGCFYLTYTNNCWCHSF